MEFKELVLNVPLSTEIEVNIRSKKDIEEILDKVSDMKNKEKILSSLIDNVQMEDDNLLFISNESSGWDLNPEYKGRFNFVAFLFSWIWMITKKMYEISRESIKY